ncbi:DUF4232 domain-containing protein [Streptomyces sp. NPDC015220]|uniref:DUF4232 domain-containing protein n=1 Tax=Streptomyces sp. NPDC015220 TaxID=3364947 RepID=UPI0036F72B79
MRTTTRRLAATAAVLAAALAVTACGPSDARAERSATPWAGGPASGPADASASPSVASPASPTAGPGTPGSTAAPASASPSAAPSTARGPGTCGTDRLRWTLVLLRPAGSGGPGARLTAVNGGPGSCVFAGYPGVEIHNGKANSVDGLGRGRFAPLELREGAGVAFDIRYTPAGSQDASPLCVSQKEAVVWAAHDRARAVVPVLDTRHRVAVMRACGEYMTMTPPRRTPPAHPG